MKNLCESNWILRPWKLNWNTLRLILIYAFNKHFIFLSSIQKLSLYSLISYVRIQLQQCLIHTNFVGTIAKYGYSINLDNLVMACILKFHLITQKIFKSEVITISVLQLGQVEYSNTTLIRHIFITNHCVLGRIQRIFYNWSHSYSTKFCSTWYPLLLCGFKACPLLFMHDQHCRIQNP